MKTTTNLSLALIFGLTGASASFGDPVVVQTTVVTTTSSAPVLVVKDGFTESYSQVMITRNGVTKVLEYDMKLHNGIVVHRDGIIVVPGKMNKRLRSGDWLAFDGTLTRADTGKVESLRPVD
jgi:hypothetical protein